MLSVQERIAAVRGEMRKNQLSAWISITSDPHASEYLPAHWAERAWLSGFSGSAGTLIVTENETRLWTDSRYWAQAEKQLSGSGILLMKDGADQVPSWTEWLSRHLAENSTAALNGECVSAASEKKLRTALSTAGIRLRTDLDLTASLWEDRAPVPSSSVYESRLSPESPASKLSRLRTALKEKGVCAFAVSALDEIGWITNLRGSDIPYNPVFLSHLIVTEKEAFLFADRSRFSSELIEKLKYSGFTLRPYEDFRRALSELSSDTHLLIDPAVISAAARSAVPAGVRVTEALSPLALFKTRKSADEIRLTEQAMVEDGAALCRFYAWLEKAISSGEKITELDVSRRLHEERAKSPFFISESFETIAAAGPNAALPHYTPGPESNAVLEDDTVLLIDSGAQYACGTTDITRVTPIHRPPEALKRDYTAVLRGHLKLLTAQFPEGAYASQLDTFARMPIWEHEADFGHGTGHGVGFLMNVHERPYSISPRSVPSEATKTAEGIIVSDEPGLYRDGRWGIRIESLVTPVVKSSGDFGRFMSFRALTLCPIDTRLIVARMMKPDEIAALNEYHLMVRAKLKDHVSGDALEWLKARTEIF